MAARIVLDLAGPALPRVRQNLQRWAPGPFVIEPRPRGLRLNLSGGSLLPGAGVDGDGGPALGFPCAFFGGDHLQVAQSVGAATTSVVASRSIARPFVVRYVSFFSNGTDPTNAQVLVKLSADNDTSGGVDTSGIPLDTVGFGTVDFSGVGVKQESWPNKIWTSVPAYIKVVLRNGTAAAVLFQVVIDVEYMQ